MFVIEPSLKFPARSADTCFNNQTQGVPRMTAVPQMTRLFACLLAALAALTVYTASANAATVPVQSLSGAFAATNSSVTKTPDGVHFGVYDDAGTTGGSLFYSGANGLTLSQITALGYTYQYNTSDDNRLGAPYLRIFLNGDTSDVIFDPTLCATVTPTENEDHAVNVVASTVRYNDDGCDGVAPDNQPWADVVAAHGTDVVSGIYITQGFSGGLDASALVRNLTVNADTFAFNVPPVDGDDGANGAPGATGPQGSSGINGANGTNGVTTTRIVREPFPVITPTPNSAACKGDEVRRLRAPSRKGERFLSARATVTINGRTLRLPVRGRRITVDLPADEGNYNIKVRSRYRKASGGVRVVNTTRSLSVACS
jgi:hypothetical protein